jgi:hypothetical protein
MNIWGMMYRRHVQLMHVFCTAIITRVLRDFVITEYEMAAEL